MKTPWSSVRLSHLLFASAACAAPILATAAESGTPSASEILKRSIQYHDPEGKWDRFSGQVRLVTAFSNGRNRGEEIIELRNAEKFYQSTRRLGSTTIIKGIRGGTCFRSIDGNSDPAKDLVKQHNLGDSAIKGMHQHQRAHLGFVMEIAASGSELNPTVTPTEFHGQKVFALTMTGRPGKVAHSYWSGEYILYIDRQNFALRGYKNVPPKDTGQTVMVLGAIEFAGVKVPSTKVYHSNEGEFQFTDVFTRP